MDPRFEATHVMTTTQPSRVPNLRRSFRALSACPPNTVQTKMGSDQSGQKIYKINSIGFRGNEFDRNASKNIFVFGCSYTFGIGLNEDEIWPRYLHAKYCEENNLEISAVNLMNFALGGASNQEIAYTTLLQCTAAKPDLAIVQFTHCERYQFVFGHNTIPIGPWVVDLEWNNPEHKAAAIEFYRRYRDEQGSFDMVMSMLHVQDFLRNRGIEYLIIAAALPTKITRPVQALLKLLDHGRVVWLRKRFMKLEKENVFSWSHQPRASDNLHPGPAIHIKTAEIIWDRYVANHRAMSA